MGHLCIALAVVVLPGCRSFGTRTDDDEDSASDTSGGGLAGGGGVAERPPADSATAFAQASESWSVPDVSVGVPGRSTVAQAPGDRP